MEKIKFSQFGAYLLSFLSATALIADTRGPIISVSCPIDGSTVSFRPLKSRLVAPFTATGERIQPPELHECSRCGFVADAPEWLSDNSIDIWTYARLAAWLSTRGKALQKVERWAGIGDLLGLSPRQQGTRYLMASAMYPQRRSFLRQQAERSFSQGDDAWSVYFEAELRRQRGEVDAWARFEELKRSYPDGHIVGRWVRERLASRSQDAP